MLFLFTRTSTRRRCRAELAVPGSSACGRELWRVSRGCQQEVWRWQARAPAGDVALAGAGAGGRCGVGRRGRQQEVWRASRGVALEAGGSEALHEGRFRWGFHRIPLFRSPSLAAPFRKGDTPSSPCDPRACPYAIGSSLKRRPLSTKGRVAEEGEISAWDLLRGTGSDHHTSTTITAANALDAQTSYRRIQQVLCPASRWRLQEASPHLPMALAREKPHLLLNPSVGGLRTNHGCCPLR